MSKSSINSLSLPTLSVTILLSAFLFALYATASTIDINVHITEVKENHAKSIDVLIECSLSHLLLLLSCNILLLHTVSPRQKKNQEITATKCMGVS